jgi:hypothetical protein
MWLDEEVLKKEFIKAAPKLRGKYRVDEQKLKMLLEGFDLSKVNFCYPSEMNNLALANFNGQAFAIRARRGKKARRIPLHYVQLGMGRKWITFDKKAVPELTAMVQASIPESHREVARKIWNEIFDALRLDEIGFERA